MHPGICLWFCGWEGVVRAASKMCVFTHRHHVSRCLGFKNLCILVPLHIDAAGGSVVKPENRVVHEKKSARNGNPGGQCATSKSCKCFMCRVSLYVDSTVGTGSAWLEFS